ncbi:hypothetical protein HYW21_05795 [Candidatus Woesearchaeota archaeon]|nr:hypothetical protein [Candidatus Woesearchaeota archaeon]
MEETVVIQVLTDNGALDIALDTIARKKQALIFANTKSSAEKTAEDLAKKIVAPAQGDQELSIQILNVLSHPTKQCQRLARCVAKGVAFHHAGLAAKQRELIEDWFRQGTIKIICSTPTLAAGVDLPAYRTILKSVKRYGVHGLDWIPVLEYLQMAGRAGRPSFDNEGESVLIASSEYEAEELFDRYICGVPEEIQSKLAVEPVMRTALLAFIATGFLTTREKMLDFFSKTFYAHQFGDTHLLEQIIDRMLRLLGEWHFLQEVEGDFQSADQIGRHALTATKLGKRVAELYIDPLTAHYLVEQLETATKRSVTEFSFLHMICRTLELRPLLKVKQKELEKIEAAYLKAEHILLEKEPLRYDYDYEEYYYALKTALFFQDWMEETTEETLLEHYDIRPGEISVKLDLADWILYATEELAKLLAYHSLLKEITKLRIRLHHGVKEELIPLMKFKGIGRVRARRLFHARIHDVGDVKAVAITTLAQILGTKLAADIKQQVDQDLTKELIPKGRRKGQTSILKYGQE